MPATKVAPRTYFFHELDPKGKARAIEQWRDDSRWWGDDGDLHNLLSEDLSDHHGVTNCELSYSLGYCQGEGVAFAGNPDIDHWAEHDEHLKGMLTELAAWDVLCGEAEPDLRVQITNDGRYSHWNSMTLSLTNNECWDWAEEGTPLSTKLSDIEDYLTQAIKDISQALEETGYAEIEYRDSDEAIADTLSANTYEFTRAGERL